MNVTSPIRWAGATFALLSLQTACASPPSPPPDLLETGACQRLVVSTEVGLPHTKELTSHFLNGWWPDRGSGWLRAPTGRASIALATDGTADRLVVEAELGDRDATAAVVSSAGLHIRRVDVGFEIDVSSLVPGHHVLELELPPDSRARRARVRFDREAEHETSTVELCTLPPETEAHWQRGPRWQLLSGSRTLLDSADLGATGSRKLELPSSLTVVRQQDARLTLRSPRAPAETEAPSARSVGETPDVVLLYVQDALRSDSVRALPESSTWKALSRQGLRLTQHRSVAPNTLPSTKALFTGRVWASGGGRALPEAEPTLAEAFREAGFRTGLFSNNPWISASYGLDRGFDQSADALAKEEEAFFDDVSRVQASALEWLGSEPLNRPVFLYVHVLHPHNPYDPPPHLAEQCPDADVDGTTDTLRAIRNQEISLNEAQESRLRCLYGGSLFHADAELGEFLEELRSLRRQGAPLQILTVLTSDHGEELFEHDGVLHGYTLFEEQLRIPLVAHWPGHLESETGDFATSTLNVHDALLALARGAAGDEFRAALTAPRESHFAAAASVGGGIFSLQRGSSKLVWAPRRGQNWGQGQGLGRRRDVLELYDLKADPHEKNRLPVGTGETAAPWLDLWLELRDLVLRASDQTDDEAFVDPEVEERLRALGYLDG